jgi:5-methyltetrahydropteroyltriglutamate--homocysteine methyltransferase
MKLLPTTIVGSYPQPEWLIDRARLAGRFPPRVRARELWRIAPEFLQEAQDDATIMAIKAQEDAGIDIITDGEMRRESYSNRFATALDGVDIDNPGSALDRSGHPNPVPRVIGQIRRRHAVEVDDVLFLRRHTTKQIKISVPGPFTMSQQAQIDFYGGSRELAAMDYAVAVNEEIRDLFSAGADVVQIDEPYAIIHTRPSGYSFLPELQNCACDQISIETAQSRLDCSVLGALAGKTIMLGVIDLADMQVETPSAVAARIRRALPYMKAENIVVCTDCGMKYLPRDVAAAKMAAMVQGAQIVRGELAGN